MRAFSTNGQVGAAIGLAAVLGFTSAALAPPAHACGGLFCSQSNPVNQQAERIIFADNGDGTVTAVIEIQYAGPSESFSWVLPVPGVPDVAVSSQVALDRLQGQTNPLYQLTRIFNCPTAGAAGAAAGGTGGALAPTQDAADPSVIVLDAGTVGPFDYEVISLNPNLAEPADAAIEWLGDNGYDVTALGPEVLGPYLEDGLNLIAFRLTKSAESGSIRPIRITYASELPFIPIRPTAVAAAEDMGILVWVLGAERAIPKNYKHLILNDARIDWFNSASNYDEVVSAAADEAGGQGFVTEMADATDVLDGSVVFPWERDEWMRLSTTSYADAYALLRDAGTFQGWDGFSDAVTAAATLPADVDIVDFLGCTACYEGADGVVFDQQLLLTGLWEKVVRPMFDTQDLLDGQAYFTRFYTTMSADEMTVDPSFDFNPDLDDVSNVHTATLTSSCDSDEWQVELPEGDLVNGEGAQVWPSDPDQPAALKILQLATEGAGETLEDNTQRVQQLLGGLPYLGVDGRPATGGPSGAEPNTAGGFSMAGESGGDTGADTGLDEDTGESRNACGCRVPGGRNGPQGVLALLLGVLAGLRLRTRRRGRRQ